MIDLINRLREQRENIRMKKFKEGGGVGDTKNDFESTNPITNAYRQTRAYLSGIIHPVDYGNSAPYVPPTISQKPQQPVLSPQGTVNGAKPTQQQAPQLSPGLPGYQPTTSNIMQKFNGVNGDQKSYMPGSSAEQAYNNQQNLQKQFTTTSSNPQPKQDRNQALAALLASSGTSSMESMLYGLGNALGAKEGTPGKGLSIAGNAGGLALSGARSLLSGVGYAKAFDQTQDWGRDQMVQNNNVYTNATQYQNANTTGGTAQGRYGGLMGFADGGDVPSDTDTTDAATLHYQNIAKELTAKYPTVEALDQYLQSQNVDDVTYQGIMDQATQMYNTEDDSQTAVEDVSANSFREGGESKDTNIPFNKKVGDTIHFEYGGKIHKGTISKIENGKIYL
jgi:hypothetical protein